MSNYFKVSALEGTPVLPFSLFFIFIFCSLALITSGVLQIIFWVLVSPFALLVISTLYLRLSHKWGHVHYPLMVRYASMAGMVMGLYPNKNVEDRIDEALILLLQSVYPKMIEAEAVLLFRQMTDKVDVFHNKEVLAKVFGKQVPNRSHEENEKYAVKIIGLYKKGSENSFKVNHFMSELIKYKYGEDEQLEYIYAVLSGKAK